MSMDEAEDNWVQKEIDSLLNLVSGSTLNGMTVDLVFLIQLLTSRGAQVIIAKKGDMV